MDGHRFDGLARSLAVVTSRRSVFAAVGGGLIVALGRSSPAEAKRPKVELCHKGKTISVAEPAVRAHLRHGDTLGPCCVSGKICEYDEAPGGICCPNATDGCVLFDYETQTPGTACCPAHRTCTPSGDLPGYVCCPEDVPCADNGNCCPSGKSCVGIGGRPTYCCPNPDDACVDPFEGQNSGYGWCCPPERICRTSEGGSFDCCEGACVDGLCVRS
jgi:hypothetical protein